jgi:lipoprotein NlpI
MGNGDYDRAVADCNEAIRLSPKDSVLYFNRGLANLYVGSLPEAAADFNKSRELTPQYAYTALWLDVVDERSKLPSRLAQSLTRIDMTKWPAPLIRLYLGQMTSEAVLAAADDPDANRRKVQICEANFFTAEWAVQHGAKDEAERLFGLVASGCETNVGLRAAANAELKAFGAQP